VDFKHYDSRLVANKVVQEPSMTVHDPMVSQRLYRQRRSFDPEVENRLRKEIEGDESRVSVDSKEAIPVLPDQSNEVQDSQQSNEFQDSQQSNEVQDSQQSYESQESQQSYEFQDSQQFNEDSVSKAESFELNESDDIYESEENSDDSASSDLEDSFQSTPSPLQRTTF